MPTDQYVMSLDNKGSSNRERASVDPKVPRTLVVFSLSIFVYHSQLLEDLATYITEKETENAQLAAQLSEVRSLTALKPVFSLRLILRQLSAPMVQRKEWQRSVTRGDQTRIKQPLSIRELGSLQSALAPADLHWRICYTRRKGRLQHCRKHLTLTPSVV